MSEWWTYRLSDFLMFSPTTYGRLVERYNRELWPLQLGMIALGALLLWLVAMRRPSARRVVPAVLAVLWLWVAWAFHSQRYATINWAAQYFAAAFVLQAVLLATVAVLVDERSVRRLDSAQWTPALLLVLAGLLYPLLAPASGRPWPRAEVFGLMPEPTALATLGLLLGLDQRRIWLFVIPVLSLAVGAATAWLLWS